KPPEKPAPAAAAPSGTDTLARDYEFAERIGTRQAWDTFLAAHSTGFFADLARAARDKIIAAEQRVIMGREKTAEEETNRKSQQAPTVIASAPSAPEATRALPQMDQADIARLLQFHLKRVGCDPGTVDGKWTDQSTRAMAEFNKRAKASFDVKVASLGALDAVKQQKARLCPLVCSKGFRAEEDRCGAEACKRGFVRNKANGECERETKAGASPTSREEGGGGGGGGNQVFCTERGGCSAVPKNCRIVYGAGGAGSSGNTASVGG